MPITPELIKKAAQIPIFSGLTAHEASEVLEVALELREGPGKVLCKEGDSGDSLLVILDGEVRVTRKGVELARLTGGTALGEMTLLDDAAARSATATVVRDAHVLKVPSRRVQKLLKADSVAALKVVANLARVMSQRLTAINEKLVRAVEETGAASRTPELSDFGRILTRWDF
jgi:CRP-like cAMP-binding protein